jgi:hypothetical protein
MQELLIVQEAVLASCEEMRAYQHQVLPATSAEWADQIVLSRLHAAYLLLPDAAT